MRRRALVAVLAAGAAGAGGVAAGAAAQAPHGSPGAAPGHGAPAGGGGHGSPAGTGGHGASAGAEARIDMGASSFLPAHLDVLAGDTVTWRNDSVRRHTVAGEDGAWDVGPVAVGEERSRRLTEPGTVGYFCRLHPGMRGEVGVHRLLLDRRPDAAAPGRPFPLTGRAALPEGTSVALEADAGDGFRPAGEATVGAGGRFSATIRPQGTATWRAVAGGEASRPVPVLVTDRRIRATVRRDGGRATITAAVTPAAKGGTVVLQLRLPERFGWWPVARARLDAHGHARFVRRPGRTVPARVVLTLPDGATELARSPAFTLHGRAHRGHGAPGHAHGARGGR